MHRMIPRTFVAAAVLLTLPAVRAQIAEPEAMVTMPGSTIEPQTTVRRELAVFPVRDGQVVLVEQLGGEVAFLAAGKEAMKILGALFGDYDLSGLEVFEALGGNRESAPASLVNDHRMRYAGNSAAMRKRRLPSLESITAVTSPAHASSDLGTIGGAACVDGPVETFDYFKSWFSSYSAMFTGVGALGDLGSNGITGNGQWTKGNVNVNLGPTGAGAVCVCFPSGHYDNETMRVIVQQEGLPGQWVDLWSSNSLFTGAAYGYWFKGFVLRRVRLLVRENEDSTGHAFYWAGSY